MHLKIEHFRPAVFSVFTHLFSINLAILLVAVSNAFHENFPHVSHYLYLVSHQILEISIFKYVLSPSFPFFTSIVSLVQVFILLMETVPD